jgi:hypothetical protein
VEFLRRINDTTLLRVLAVEAGSVDQKPTTQESVAMLVAALARAGSVLADPNSTQEMIDAAAGDPRGRPSRPLKARS